MKKSLVMLALTVNILALSACNNESSQVMAETEKLVSATDSRQGLQQQANIRAFSGKKSSARQQSDLPYLQDLTPQQLANLIGFGNQQLLMLQQDAGPVTSYQLQKHQSRLLAGEVAPQGNSVACQDFSRGQINWFTVPTASNSEFIKQLHQDEVVTALCGNITAGLSPEVFVLTRASEQLTLFLVSPNKLFEFAAWRQIATITAEANVDYYLLPGVSHHSASSLQIARQQQGKWQQLKTFYPRDFVGSFTYKAQDHDEVWMKYLNLDRASAKLMWNAGAKSIGKLNLYFDSVNPGLTAHAGSKRNEIEQVLYYLDPNGNDQVSQRLTDIYVRWKVPGVGAGK